MSSTGKPFPRPRQRDQKGKAKRYYQKRYRKNKSRIKQRAHRWYDKNKGKFRFKKDQERRRKYPEKFDRKPSGGYSTNADRARDRKKKATTVFQILQNVKPEIVAKAKQLPVVLNRVDNKNGVWLFDVTGTKVYRVRVKIKDIVVDFDAANPVISCNCPFWRWQGPEHWGKTEKYQYGPYQGTASYPVIRDPNHEKALCKHAVAVLSFLKTRLDKRRHIQKLKQKSKPTGQGKKAMAEIVAKIVKRSMDEGASSELMRFLGNWAKRNGLGHIYVVGGAPRNFLMGYPIKDLDLVVDSVALGRDSEWVARKLMQAVPAEMTLATNNYGVAILTITGDWILGGFNLRGENIEIANAREESYTGVAGKGYKPSEVVPATIEQDVKRREFRVNTLLWRLVELAEGPDKAEVLDLTGCGLSDLEQGVLHCPADPDVTFKDDPTRIIRAVKFFVKYGLKLDKETEMAIRRNVQYLKKVPHSAITDILLHQVLVGKDVLKALMEMRRLGILDVVADLVREVPPFKASLVRWMGNQKVALLFTMLDLGLDLGDRISFLSPSQQKLFRQVALTLEEPEEFLASLKQPGKVFDLPMVLKVTGFKGAQVKALTDTARDLLLHHPHEEGKVLTRMLIDVTT